MIKRYGASVSPYLPPITKTIQVRRPRHAGHCWRSRDELISDVLLWTPTYGRAKAGRPARTYIQQLRIQDVAKKTCQRRWTIGKSGEIGSWISVLPARHDDDDDDIYIYIYLGVLSGIWWFWWRCKNDMIKSSKYTNWILILCLPLRK